ncbi:hypothetical protein CEXT_519341 [Caerostris extrusa]|uniref:Uncharacterized protein n=1 Tax=Caerostris extrusa TaxID=172846 RepID=A0AAV4TFB9_CAEEX|nr:hypothetical protein CEXT_519341 [Caerostris extrusa]
MSLIFSCWGREGEGSECLGKKSESLVSSEFFQSLMVPAASGRFRAKPQTYQTSLDSYKSPNDYTPIHRGSGMMYDPGITNSIQEHPSIKLWLNTPSAGSEPILKLMMQRERRRRIC